MHTNRQILNIALPAIVSNITVPLLGLVDVAIVGHLGAASYIGAIAVGGMAFNVLYWIFAFLRMGTSGLTSQALGRHDLSGVVAQLLRSLLLAMGIALLLIVFQGPLCQAVLWAMSPEAEVAALATTYFKILIWGAPAMLGLFSLSGWFIGMQNSRIPMFIAIMQNVLNILASLVLVFGLGLKVEGVALGTLLAQYGGFLAGMALLWRNYRRLRPYTPHGALWHYAAMAHFFRVNRDIFLRTVCMVSVMLFFTSSGSRQGTVVLAVNTLLMQFNLLFSYVMDGFAYAGEALSGRFYGARNHAALVRVVKRLFAWGAGMAAAFTLLYGVGGDAFLELLTDEPSVVIASHAFYHWALALPFCGLAAYVWDGIFIGCTRTRYMLLSMAAAAATFFTAYFVLTPTWANHGLWIAFLLFLLMRGGVQTLLWHRANLMQADC